MFDTAKIGAIAPSPKSRCAPSPGSYNRLALHGRHHTVPAVTRRTPKFRHGDVLTLNHTVAQFLSTA